MKRFFEVRKVELEKWAQGTGRKVVDDFSELTSDNFAGAYECNWQQCSPGHCNLFCSLGEWACNVTDLLKDTRFDRFYFDEEEEAAVLFRHYTRIMLVISELLTDFQDIYLHAERLQFNKENRALARRFYFPSYIDEKDDITLILDYINSVCKHKTQHLHICNNHSPIHFEDNITHENFNYVSLKDSKTAKDKNAILVPKLSNLVDTLLTCYKLLDNYFKDNNLKWLFLCRKFSNEYS